MVVLDTRLDRDQFNDLRNQAKNAGGWYSRQWRSTPGGFAFTDLESAKAFLNAISESSNSEPAKANQSSADKFRTMAEKLQSKIDDCFSDRLTNTPKRLAQAMHKRAEGERLTRTQSALNALAELHESGQVPAVLQNINTKAQVYDLMSAELSQVPNGYHGYSVDTGKRRYDSPEAVAIWELLTPKTEAEIKADELRQKIEGLQFSKIAGYFPTPKKVIDLMLDYADVESFHTVLEPSAGHGAIADEVKEIGCNITVVECNHTLKEILTLKGYEVLAGDFLECEPDNGQDFDRVLMNPPFENLQDIDHVLHAYKFLRAGGVLVSVMSPSPFFNGNKKATAFREFLDTVTSEVIELPENSFKESGTGVSSRLLVLHKD